MTKLTKVEQLECLENHKINLIPTKGNPMEGMLTRYTTFNSTWMIRDKSKGFWYLFLNDEVDRVEGKDVYLKEL